MQTTSTVNLPTNSDLHIPLKSAKNCTNITCSSTEVTTSTAVNCNWDGTEVGDTRII